LTYQDLVEINLKIDGKKFEPPISSLFILFGDSIYKPLPELNITFSDKTALIQESLLTCIGLDLQAEMNFLNEFDIVGGDFNISDVTMDKRENSKTIAGSVDVKGIHKWQKELDIKSEGYFSKISDIVRQLAPATLFKSVSISNTVNQDYWYQPLVNDVDFIKDYLLPYAYAPASDGSMFYFFVNNLNELYFKSYSDLYNSKPVVTLKMVTEQESNSEKDRIRVLERVVMPLDNNYKNYNRYIFQMDSDTHELVEEEDSITDYPKIPMKKLPIAKNENFTSWLYHYDTESNNGRKENNKGLKASGMVNSYYLERYLVTTMFNPKINAGSVIELDLPYPDNNDNSQKSIFMQGKFLVEKAEHIWDGKEKKLYSRLVVCRKFADVPDSFLITTKLFKT